MARLAQPRRGAVAALFAAVLVYLVAGHAHHPGQTMEEAAIGAGICIVLVTAVGVAAVARPSQPAQRVTPLTLGLPPARRLAAAPLPHARASPQWLQRFLN